MPLAPPPPAHAAVVSNQEHAIVREVNAVRRSAGLPTVKVSLSLSRAADRQTHRILARDRFRHGRFTVRMRRSGVRFRKVGENLAWVPRGRSTAPRSLVRMWLGSPTHRRVLLDRRFRRIGVGRGRGALGSRRGTVVTASFGSYR